MLLQKYLLESAGRFPEKPAVIQGSRRISYETIRGRAAGVAKRLAEEGLAPGDRVGLMLENSPEYIIAYFGVLLAGGVVVPLSDQVTSRGFTHILSDCGARAAFVQRKATRIAAESLPALPGVRTLVVADVTASEKKAAAAGPPVALPDGVKAIGLDDIGADKGDQVAAIPRAGQDLAMILYTSGTTGEPKGVMLTHRNLRANAESIIDYLRLTADDKVLAVLPFYYSYGNSLLTTHVGAGGTLVLENSFLYPNVVLDRMEKEEVTGFSGVPSTFAILLNRSNIRERRFPKLRYVTQAGGAMSPIYAQELTRVLPGTEIFIMYGQTEAAARLSYLEPAEIFRKAGSIGKAIPGVRLAVVKEDGTPAAPGEVGEIVAQGANIMAGYWNKPAETAAALKEDGLHTGDLARVDAEGFFYIVGRQTEMIKSGAHRISPKEIEEVVLELPGVHEVAVVGVEDEFLGEAIVAHVVRKAGAAVTERDIQAHCRKALPPYKVPRTVSFCTELPKTDSGKVKKHVLAATTAAKPLA